MKTVQLGNTGEMISSIALGTMYFGTRIDEQTSFSILDLYSDKGGKLFDTANKYARWVPGFQGGESETLLGKWIRKRKNRNNLFICTKVGLPYGDVPRSLKKEVMISECEKSLKRLCIETIDLYFAHGYDKDTEVQEVMETFYLLKKQGKIRFAGASNYYSWQISESNSVADIQGWEGFSCIQQRHTYLQPYLRTGFGNQLLLTPDLEALCLQKKLTIMAYSPLLGGAYTNKDRPVPAQYPDPDSKVKIRKLREVANDLKVSINTVVLAWMIQNVPEIIPIVAGSSLGQIEENLQVLSIRLSSEHLEILKQEDPAPEKF